MSAQPREPDGGRVSDVLGWKMRACLVAADSVLSLIAHRHGSAIPDGVREDALAVSADCRRAAEEAQVALDAATTFDGESHHD